MQTTTATTIERFNRAFQTRDASILTGLISEDCVMEGAYPPPDGSRIVGRSECLSFWEELINTPDTQFTPELVSVTGENAVILWRFEWGTEKKSHIRGVNLMTVKEGLITEALGYVKGSLS
jgi:ketosteroid isomerase-like protein